MTWGVPLLVSYHFAFSCCLWGSQGKNTEVVCHSHLQWTTFCQTSPPWPVCLGWPHRAWLSFIELDKAVILVWLDWLVFCDYSFSLSALWCPLSAPTVLLGFLFLVFFPPLEVCISLVHLVIVCISVVIDISPGILIPACASSNLTSHMICTLHIC